MKLKSPTFFLLKNILILYLLTSALQAQNLVGSTTVIWSDLPHQSMDWRDELFINSPLYHNLKANITKDRLVISERGASFHTDMTENVEAYPEWVQIRAELRESPLSSVNYGNTQIYEFEFEVDQIPHLDGGVTIFQRFNKSIDDPDFSIMLKGDGQWPGDPIIQNSSIVMKPFGLDWVRTYTLLKAKNHLKIAIYSHQNGYYKVSLNGETLGEGATDTTPDLITYSGPQFGVYNHGGTIERIGLTHTKYIYTEYDDIINFDTITTIDPNSALEIEEFKKAELKKLKILTNPAKDFLHLNMSASIKGKEFFIFNILGKEVLKGFIISEPIDINQLDTGLYLLSIENYVAKFIKI